MSNDSLFHYGVLGMRWGKKKATSSADHSEAVRIRKNSIRTLSNKELQAVVTRKKLEKSYKEQTASLEKKIVAGAIAGLSAVLISDLVKGGAKLASKAGKAAVDVAIEKIGKDAAASIAKKFG